jgi:uncharacterized protein YfiM (DUF2279 family)
MSRANGYRPVRPTTVRLRSAPLVFLLLLNLLPARPVRAQDAWFGPDKLLHFLGGFFVTTAGYTFAATALDWEHDRARAFGVGAGVAASIGKEVWDGLSGRGDPSGKDLFWDGIGIGLGVVVVNGPLRLKETPQPGAGLRIALVRPSGMPGRGGTPPLPFPLKWPSPAPAAPAARNPLTIQPVSLP